MRLTTLPLTALFTLLLAFQAVPASPQDLTLKERLDTRLAALTGETSHAVAVLIARDGKVAYQGAFGMADIEQKTPATIDTVFRIGSVSKQFTASAILHLADQGKLSLTDPLSKFFPDFPNGASIPLHQLLTHTSGIHSYTSKPDFLSRVTRPIDPAALIEYFRDDPPDFAPGTRFQYNNSAYFLAGEIVAKASGKSLGAYLQEAFFTPLGMKSTGVFVNATPPAGVAKGYSFADGKLVPALDWDMSWAGGAGALYSTIGDLMRWNEALYGGKLLKAESLKAQTTPVVLPPEVDHMHYGYGLMISVQGRLPVFSHGGGLNGWSSDLLWFPEQRCTVAVLANGLPPKPGLEPAALSRALAAEFLAEDMRNAPPLTEAQGIDPTGFAALAGRYDYKTAVMTVTVEEDCLFAQVSGQPKHRLFAKSPTVFFWKVTDAQVEFIRNEQGDVVAAVHSQGGNTFRAARLPDAELDLSEQELDAILGEYDYGPGAVLTVSRQGKSVFAQLTGQPRFPIFARSATEFEWRVVPASVTFVKDADGRVTKAVHSQGGTTFDAPRLK